MNETQKNSEEMLKYMAEMMVDMVPFAKYLNISIQNISHGKVTGLLPYDEKDEKTALAHESGIMHGGAVSTAIDNLSGLAALTLTVPPHPLVTLDLRIDYNCAPEKYQDIIIEAECYRTTKNVSFVRSIAHNGNADHVIAHSVSVFMRAQMGNKS